MTEQEMSEYLKGKPQEEIREFIIDRLKKICEEGEKLFVNDEDYERAGELLEIKIKIDMNKETKFKVGDKAHKTKGYKFPCTIVGVFETIKGDIRVVGEMDEYGLLHIFNEDQLEKVTEPINGEVKSKWDL